jgi:hypothetical protein
MEMELRASGILGKHSTAEVHTWLNFLRELFVSVYKCYLFLCIGFVS